MEWKEKRVDYLVKKMEEAVKYFHNNIGYQKLFSKMKNKYISMRRNKGKYYNRKSKTRRKTSTFRPYEKGLFKQ